MDKKNLRATVLQDRRALDYVTHDRGSRKIIEQLYKTKSFYMANNIMCFISFESEVYTHELIRECIKRRKQIYVPVVHPEDGTMSASLIRNFTELEKGPYDILAPMPEYERISDPKVLDLIITPGVAFDLKGNRIGYGKGYYDKFFKLMDKDVTKLALAFELQIINEVPANEDDIPVDYIITEKRIINCKENRGE